MESARKKKAEIDHPNCSAGGRNGVRGPGCLCDGNEGTVGGEEPDPQRSWLHNADLDPQSMFIEIYIHIISHYKESSSGMDVQKR